MKKHFFILFALSTICINLFFCCGNTLPVKNNFSNLENEIVLELNKIRTSPAKYAEEVLRPRLKYFDGDLYNAPGEIPLKTNEGVIPVEECINVLKSTKPLPPLSLEKGLCLSAQWLADDQARTGTTGHYGSDNSAPLDRMNRYGTWNITAGENCAYGPKDAVEIVAQLLIDDGVKNRGHRTNILNKDFKKVGVGFSDKDKAPYGAVSVMDFAGDYISK